MHQVSCHSGVETIMPTPPHMGSVLQNFSKEWQQAILMDFLFPFANTAFVAPFFSTPGIIMAAV